MNPPQKTLMNANLFSRLFDGLDDPTRLAIETVDGQRISYGDLIARAGQTANVLVARGVKPGDRVAAQTEKSEPGLVLYLAAVRAGAMYLPLNTAYTLNELEYFITDAEPSLVVCDPSKAEGIGAIAAKLGARVETLARATVLMGVTTFYTRLLQSPALSHESTKHMRLLISGSAPLLADTHREWAARTGHAVLERYGMTETNMNTSNPYDGDRVPGAVGHALPGVTVRVTDPDTGKELARETIGMIEVKGPNVFKGYWRMPEKTKAEFRDDGFFITGDLGKIDANGYVHILGRGKDLVISGGFNVYPKEIESEIDAMPGVVGSAGIR